MTSAPTRVGSAHFLSWLTTRTRSFVIFWRVPTLALPASVLPSPYSARHETHTWIG